MKLNIKRGVPVEQFFLDALEDTIVQHNEQTAEKSSQSFKPSSMQCSRKSYFQLTGTELDKGLSRSATLTGITESGSDRHDRLQNWIMKIKDYNYPIDYVHVPDFLAQYPKEDIVVVGQRGAETKLFNKRLNMSFMCDGILKINSAYYILEIKTESTFKFKYRTGVAPEHIKQATCYYLNFGLPVIFLYENRDFSEKKAYLYEPTEKDEEDVFRTMLQAQMGVDGGYVPEIPANIYDEVDEALAKKKLTQKAHKAGEWRDGINTCKYCDYKERCTQFGEGKVELKVRKEHE